MAIDNLQNTETLLLETLLSGLDARENAKKGGSPMLVYLADMLVQRTRQELETVKTMQDPTTSADGHHPS